MVIPGLFNMSESIGGSFRTLIPIGKCPWELFFNSPSLTAASTFKVVPKPKMKIIYNSIVYSDILPFGKLERV